MRKSPEPVQRCRSPSSYFQELKMTHDSTALRLRAEGTDRELLESVIEFYRNRFKEEPAGSE